MRRVRYQYQGVVQGVGFRPFIHRLATAMDLAGFVQNRSDGVVVEVEGAAVDLFGERVLDELPPLADVYDHTREDLPPTGGQGFRIIPSEGDEHRDVHIPPDIATCDDCLRELFDPDDRRYRYPFINCTNCGPRLTIIRDIPYDRDNTSMKVFPLCEDCRGEYDDPADRRFHAEPNACPTCGPQLQLLDEAGNDRPAADPLREAARLLKEGYILAVKGLGGFHLCVDATDDSAVKRLRVRKHREEKPFAVMVRDLDMARRLARVDDDEAALLTSPRRPIVLCERLAETDLAPSVAPGVPAVGLMLPYTPLHHLLLAEGFTALVMTSANATDEPICIKNDEAVRRLGGIADAFLIHDREILVRCDDSIAAVRAGRPRVHRRSRGYAPLPLVVPAAPEPVLALGPELKNTVCVLKDSRAFLSPHIGDLSTPEARDFFHESLELMERITECRPKIVACDLHPDYYSTRHAGTLTDVEFFPVQHHHAHIVSCMAEHGLTESLGLAFDGTGYGPDGTVWGGEFIHATAADYTRRGRLRTFTLPGGERAIREPWRIAAALLRETWPETWADVARNLDLLPEDVNPSLLEVMMARGLNCPRTSSMGRLFDGVAALLGVRHTVSFEGQAAMELETLASEPGEALAWDLDRGVVLNELDWRPLVRVLVKRRLAGESPARLAADFHATVIHASAKLAAELARVDGLSAVTLSGGCFQNRLLLEGLMQALKNEGLEACAHERVPTNDGGIALGQAVSAAAQLGMQVGMEKI